MALAFWIVIALRALIAPAPVAVPAPADRSAGDVAEATVGTAVLDDRAQVGARDTFSVVEREAWVMGTRLRTVIEVRSSSPSGTASATAAGEAVLREVERLDALLSTWRPTSAISRLNAAPPGRPVAVDAEVLELLAEADAWASRTGRAFDPTVGALVDAWDLRGRGRRPGPDVLGTARAATGPGVFRFDTRSGRAERRHPGAWLDAGGFGKGAALRRVPELLGTHGVERALVDLGGQLWLAGGGRSWSIGVAHPSRRHEVVARILAADVSVATSGTSERRVVVEGETFGHILDPRTGRPAPPWGSVTVVSADALEADVLATALYVMGPERGARWARAHTGAGVLFLEERDGRLRATWNQPMDRWLVEPPRPASSATTPDQATVPADHPSMKGSK